MQIGESKEKYLEAIYTLTDQQDIVLAVDIAHYLKHSKPSVSLAIRELVKLGYVHIGLHNAICLTDAGQEIAMKLHDRCGFFETMLLQCGLAQSRAEEDAHRLMHAISDEGFVKLRKQYS